MTDAKSHSRDEAVAELSFLNQSIDQARVALARTLTDLQDAQAQLSGNRMMRLLAANAHLVREATRLRRDAASSAIALDLATRSGELDPLTRLPNRTLLAERLLQAIGGAKRHEVRLALLFLDLDHFKHHNDAFGHATGDLILVAVGERLRACVRETDTVCRLGGDEFVVLLAEVSERGNPVLVARKMLAAVNSLSQVNGHAVTLTASIGISLYPDHGSEAPALMAAADAAMYSVKHVGGNGFQFAHAARGALRMATELAADASRPLALAEHAGDAVAPQRQMNEQLVFSALAVHMVQVAEPDALPALWGPL